MALEDRLAAWKAARLIDDEAAERIAEFEARRAPAVAGESRIGVGEVIAYVGSVVLLVRLGFLYGTEYTALPSGGRLILIGLVVLGGLVAGELVRHVGAPATRWPAESACSWWSTRSASATSRSRSASRWC
jgi:hypothetical protein